MEEHQGSLLHWLFTLHILPSWMPEQLPHSFVVIILLSVLSIQATRNIKKIPSGLQNFMEWAVEGLETFTKDAIGPDGARFTPFVGTCFLYILAMNLIGVIPGMKAPTSNLNITVGMGLTAFVIVHYYALKEIGLKRWASHFVGEPLWLAPLLIPLHIIGELARPLSLSLRLYGNIFGEETVIVILAGFAPVLLQIAGVPLIAVPTQLPMVLFGMFTSFLQAMVFSMLVAIYIAVSIGDHDHEDDHGHGHEPDLLADAVPA